MKYTFDPAEAIQELVLEAYHRTGAVPLTVAVSPRTYRRLLEMHLDELSDREPPTAILSFRTGVGSVPLRIDEMLCDTVIWIDPPIYEEE